jgi:hypothetical protein
MRRFFTFAAAVVVALLAGTLAFAEREVTRAVLPYEFFGCEEGTMISGEIKTVTITTYKTRADGAVVASTRVELREGEGVGVGGEIDGVPYQISGTLTDERTIDFPDGSQKQVSHHSLRLIGQGRAPNYIEKFRLVVWLSPDGEVVDEKMQSVSECR